MTGRALLSICAVIGILTLPGAAWAHEAGPAPPLPEPEGSIWTPSSPWAVTRHPVGDTKARILDYPLTPVYVGPARAWWWLESHLYRDEGLSTRVRLHMAPPPAAEG